MNIPEITVPIGTHSVTLRPVVVENRPTESLEIISTWHETEIVHDWTIRSISVSATLSENDSDYEAAERSFIFALTGIQPTPRKD